MSSSVLIGARSTVHGKPLGVLLDSDNLVFLHKPNVSFVVGFRLLAPEGQGQIGR